MHRLRAITGLRPLRREIDALDVAVYEAIARVETPNLDRALRRLSRSADYSRLWLATAAALSAAEGERGRRAAAEGLASLAFTALIVNAVFKPLGGRRRPDRIRHDVPLERHVRMPLSTSFPSGHAASAFAFATGVTAGMPEVGIPLTTLAALVAYSRVHTGVHYPLDVLAGAIAGVALAPTAASLHRRRLGCPHRQAPQRALELRDPE